MKRHDTETSTSLTTPSAALGKEIVSMAREESERRIRESVVTVVANQQRLIAECEHAIALATMQREHYTRVIEAVERGEFTVTRSGSILLTDERLSFGHWQPRM